MASPVTQILTVISQMTRSIGGIMVEIGVIKPRDCAARGSLLDYPYPPTPRGPDRGTRVEEFGRQTIHPPTGAAAATWCGGLLVGERAHRTNRGVWHDGSGICGDGGGCGRAGERK